MATGPDYLKVLQDLKGSGEINEDEMRTLILAHGYLTAQMERLHQTYPMHWVAAVPQDSGMFILMIAPNLAELKGILQNTNNAKYAPVVQVVPDVTSRW